MQSERFPETMEYGGPAITKKVMGAVRIATKHDGAWTQGRME